MSELKITTKKRALQDIYNFIIDDDLDDHETVQAIQEYITNKYPEFVENDWYNYKTEGFGR
jgi:hypothetical protein